jgi:hypothetical protein
MAKEILIKGEVVEILDTSNTYITSGNICTQNDSVGVLVKIKDIKIKVPLIETNTRVDKNKLKEIEEILKKKYNIKPGRVFVFKIPENRYINDKVETTGYKQNVKGNVDRMVVFTSRTLYNNRIRKALLGKSFKINEIELI